MKNLKDVQSFLSVLFLFKYLKKVHNTFLGKEIKPKTTKNYN